jgi:hypothetical protein
MVSKDMVGDRHTSELSKEKLRAPETLVMSIGNVPNIQINYCKNKIQENHHYTNMLCD